MLVLVDFKYHTSKSDLEKKIPDTSGFVKKNRL